MHSKSIVSFQYYHANFYSSISSFSITSPFSCDPLRVSRANLNALAKLYRCESTCLSSSILLDPIRRNNSTPSVDAWWDKEMIDQSRSDRILIKFSKPTRMEWLVSSLANKKTSASTSSVLSLGPLIAINPLATTTIDSASPELICKRLELNASTEREVSNSVSAELRTDDMMVVRSVSEGRRSANRMIRWCSGAEWGSIERAVRSAWRAWRYLSDISSPSVSMRSSVMERTDDVGWLLQMKETKL